MYRMRGRVGLINRDTGGGLVSASLPASAVFDVDATQAASYTSGQTWANLIAAPADGSAQTAYDFHLGKTSSPATDDPTFTGTAGDASSYFALDGGDMFTLASQVNTPFLNALHKTTGGTDFWMALVLSLPDITTVTVGLSTKTAAAAIGSNLQFSTSEQARWQQTGDSGTVTTVGTNTAAVTIDTPSIVIASYSADTLRMWVNSTTKLERDMVFNHCVNDASGHLSIGSQANGGGGSSILPNGTRIYAVAMGNSYIDDADAASIIDLYNSRHGRTYA
jgi:hypothetical protein